MQPGPLCWRVLVAVSLLVVPGATSPVAAQDATSDADAPSDETIAVRWVVDVDAAVATVTQRTRRINDGTDPVALVTASLPDTAREVVATGPDGTPLLIIPDAPDGGRVEWTIGLGAPVEPGGYEEWSLRYVVPSDPVTELTHAYVSPVAVWLSVEAPGPLGSEPDPSVRVELPPGLTVDASAAAWSETRADGWSVVMPLIAPGTTAVVVAEDRTRRGEAIVVGGLDGVVFSPLPGDEGWVDAVAPRVGDLLGAMEVVTGAPRPDGDVIVLETPVPVVPRTGLVTPNDTTPSVTVALGPDPTTADIAHQVAHVWIERWGIDELWLAEGLATLLGADAADEAGLAYAAPAASGADAPALAEWSDARARTPGEVAAVDQAALARSAQVVDAIAAEIGDDRMEAVIATLRDDTITFPADPASAEGAEPQPIPEDWRTSLDAFTRVGGSSRAAALYEESVIVASDVALLTEWRSAGHDYEILSGQAAGWALPPVVRVPIAAWDFDEATRVGDTLAEVLVVRDDVAARMATVDLGVPITMQRRFETAGSVDGLVEEFEALDEQSEIVAEALSASVSDDGLLSAVGLWGTDVDADAAVVARLWTQGDTAEAVEEAEHLLHTLEGAPGRGTLRVFVPVGVVALVLFAVTSLWRRRSGSDRSGAAQPGSASRGGDSAVHS